MRRLFTTADAAARGITEDALRWRARRGDYTRIMRGVYGDGPEPPTSLDVARARVLASTGAARGRLAGVLHGYDGVELDDRPTRRGPLLAEATTFVRGVRCADALQTLIDLAADLDDLTWEQAIESALRKRLTTVAALEGALPELSRKRAPGTARIRRVLALRPPGAPATESLLETLMVQLARTVDGLPELTRQVVIHDDHGVFVARVDLAIPDVGVFFELDGQQHKDQPVYDASRQTAVTAATGWLCGRFTWREVVHTPRTTARRLDGIALQARHRPIRKAG